MKNLLIIGIVSRINALPVNEDTNAVQLIDDFNKLEGTFEERVAQLAETYKVDESHITNRLFKPIEIGIEIDEDRFDRVCDKIATWTDERGREQGYKNFNLKALTVCARFSSLAQPIVKVGDKISLTASLVAGEDGANDFVELVTGCNTKRMLDSTFGIEETTTGNTLADLTEQRIAELQAIVDAGNAATANKAAKQAAKNAADILAVGKE